MLVPILLFIVGLVLLIKGGDWFVDGATGLAHRFHVPVTGRWMLLLSIRLRKFAKKLAMAKYVLPCPVELILLLQQVSFPEQSDSSLPAYL